VNNLTSKTDRKGQTINYVHDALNRLTQKTYPDSTSIEYTYDLVGKVTQVNDPTGTYGFSYDNVGRLIGTSTQYSFAEGTLTNGYTYDAASNRVGYAAPDGSTNSYSYDTLNRLITLDNSWAGSFGFTYDGLNRRTQMTRPNSVTTNYVYDNLSHLLSVLHQASGSTIDGASYTLDPVGNRTAKTDQHADVISSYTYDPIYELAQVTHGSSTTESYSYDAVGNRTASLGMSAYTNNSSNELTGTTGLSYTYDNNGNTTSKTDSTGTTNYTWDYENRLASVALPGSGGTVNFKYDPFGRRIEKVSPTATSIFAYDGDDLVETTNGLGSEVASYTHTQNIDAPLAMLRGTTASYYEADGLGSITSVSSSGGSLAQTYTYDSYGNTTSSSGSLTNFFRYTGREFDSETGLYFLRARYLDPTTGRFISEDPLEFASGSTNFYGYVGDNPTALNDPFGLCDEHQCVGRARVLGGNPWKIGKQGGVPGTPVGANSVAGIPSQWGFSSGSGFKNLQVSGTVGALIQGPLANFYFGDVNSTATGLQQTFTGITDVMGGATPIPGMNVRDAMMELNPGVLILELVNGRDQGITTVVLNLPEGVPCPYGTLDSKLMQIHVTPFGW
jgi:RHS repeat-associated protein